MILASQTFYKNCEDFGVPCLPLGHPQNGVVHVVGPELGVTQPGMTLVCGDSHACTHGAFGALAFGIGSTEVLHVMASASLFMVRPKAMLIDITGSVAVDVQAKDIILHVIAQLGTSFATGFVLEFRGSAITELSVEQRMTLCNMAVEAGAISGLIAPDDKVFSYLEGKPYAPQGRAFQEAVAFWRSLVSDSDVEFDVVKRFRAEEILPRMTFGTTPAMSIALGEAIPVIGEQGDLSPSLQYMGWKENELPAGRHVDVVFIGSCANGRLSDLRLVAKILKGKKVATGLRLLVVPGSNQVKREAEAEGLHLIVIDAGGVWGQPGCSMCNAVNGDELSDGELAVSTTNRNFKGRQGRGGRTILASPMLAAKTALRGSLL